MRFATFAFATGAIAQITVITPIVEKILTDIGTLKTAVQGYTSGEGADILAAGKTLFGDINSGVTAAKGSSELSQTDAVQLTTPIQGLQSATEDVVKGLTAKKCALASAGKATDVLSNLQDQMTASKALSDAITSMVPQSLQTVASSLSSGITAALQGGIDSFKDTSSCGGSSSSAPPSSPAAAPSKQTPSAASYDTTAIAKNGSSVTPIVTPKNSTAAGNGTSPVPLTYNGAASTANNVPVYAGILAMAALFGAAL
ncbi:hypothetical protein FKW77_000809 [Venturia effusa]|uniref:Cell wall protein n=1 Tax=Venturia effusa TaxID=50376 RepID=A0A517LKS3_9PEZI|nr:hypothetical protein FKW77_000809 [Venturia effusa]